MKRKIIAAAGVFISLTVIVLAVIFSQRSVTLDREYEGVLWRNGDPAYEERMTVRFNGKFSGKGFDGEVTFVTSGGSRTITAYVLWNDGTGYLSDIQFHNGQVTQEGIGTLIIDRKAEKCAILIHEPRDGGDISQWDGDRGLVFTGPAGSREEAVEIMPELSQESWWLKDNKWQ